MVRTPRKSKLNLLALAAAMAVILAGWISIGSITSSTAGNVGGMSLSSPTKTEKAPRFGFRTLKEGMSGDDVRILKGLAKSQDYLGGALTTDFDSPTTSAVKKFQKAEDLSPSGVVTRKTAKTMKRSMNLTEASWYGPGLYGNGVACGGTLKASTVGVDDVRSAVITGK